jgi:IMP dehydrogenase
MSLSNGDIQGTLPTWEDIEDYTKALAVREKDYPIRDGLDSTTLLDTDKHGALTYNDFLILPSYIGATHRLQNR